jgi:hypothetical protein
MTVSGTPSSAPSYRGLLALVILLGALIMLGVGALIAGAVFGGGRARETAPFNATLDAPGAHIESTEIQGNRILVRLGGGAKGEELVILDAASGRILGRVAINAKP